jgi:hypothetical protein
MDFYFEMRTVIPLGLLYHTNISKKNPWFSSVTGDNWVIGSPYTVKSIFEPESLGPGDFFKFWTLLSLNSLYYTNLPKETRGFHL